MNPIDVVLISGAFTLVGTVLAWILARRDKKDQNKHDIQTPTPPTTQEVWKRVDGLEKVVRSAVVILGEVADQWDGPHPPILSKRHVAVLAEEGYMPPEWDPPVDDR